ncbi:MAG: YkgJ family cysteine cluster protein [Candidatus Eremiobacteraeota bacterium]|nr:YkgJ family cysteine cluster protein [Candidatus Eremiobacteraeota bacterium]
MKYVITQIIQSINKLIYRLMGKSYIREGKCNQCGACCTMILLFNQSKLVKNEEEFEQLKEVFSEYERFYIRGKNPSGNPLFTCKYLGDGGECKDYKNRPLICRDYPNEEILRTGGILVSTCGFRFVPVKDFDKVFDREMEIQEEVPFELKLIQVTDEEKIELNSTLEAGNDNQIDNEQA